MKNRNRKKNKKRLPFSAVVRVRYPYIEYVVAGGNLHEIIPDEASELMTSFEGIMDESYTPGEYIIRFDFKHFTQCEDGYDVHFTEVINEEVSFLKPLPYKYIFKEEQKEIDVAAFSAVISSINPEYFFSEYPFGGYSIEKVVPGKEYPVTVKRYIKTTLEEAKQKALADINELTQS